MRKMGSRKAGGEENNIWSSKEERNNQGQMLSVTAQRSVFFSAEVILRESESIKAVVAMRLSAACAHTIRPIQSTVRQKIYGSSCTVTFIQLDPSTQLQHFVAVISESYSYALRQL